MKVMAQIAMVMNLDKCIGCHTCSVTCKQAWTNREGTEYMLVQQRRDAARRRLSAHLGRPGEVEGRLEAHRKSGRLEFRARAARRPRSRRSSRIRRCPDHGRLLRAVDVRVRQAALTRPRTPANDPDVPAPKSRITGEHIDTLEWGPNWDDDLGGSMETLDSDPVLHQMNLQVAKTIEDAFMFYLPRICEHCLNPTCVSACPSGAMYKRTEDGIVLVDQDQPAAAGACASRPAPTRRSTSTTTRARPRSARCATRASRRASRRSVRRPAWVACATSGVLLYDADRVTWAASQKDERDLYRAQREILLDPHDPRWSPRPRPTAFRTRGSRPPRSRPSGSSSPTYEVALPLHPEFRTLPMVWYVPPLSPVVDPVTASGSDGEDHKVLLSAISQMRIPLEYLAGLFTAGDTAPVELLAPSPRRDALLHARRVRRQPDERGASPASVGMTAETVKEMYRLLAIAKYDDRYVIPTAHPEMPRGI